MESQLKPNMIRQYVKDRPGACDQFVGVTRPGLEIKSEKPES